MSRINEKANKMESNWINEDCVIIKGPYDGNHYNIKVVQSKRDKIIRVHRDRIKKSVANNNNENPNLIQYLYSMNCLDRNTFDTYVNTAKGKNWLSNMKFAFRNCQILEPE